MTLFENLELTNYDENRERRQAASLSQTRAKARFARFLAPGTEEEWNARFALIADDFRNMVVQTCSEVGYNDPEEIFTVIAENMSPGPAQAQENVSRLKHINARGKGSEQCTFTGKRPQAGEPWGMLIHPGGGFEYADPNYIKQNHPDVVDIGQGVTAASVDDGDTYTQDHVDLGSSTDGNLTQPVPTMDKSLADNEPFIDVPSADHPTEHQNINDVADLASDFTPKDLGLVDRIDVEKPLQPEFSKGETGVFPIGNMAAPVTSGFMTTTLPNGTTTASTTVKFADVTQYAPVHDTETFDPSDDPHGHQRSDMITHPAAQDLVGQDYTPGSLQDWAAQLDKMGLSQEDAWKAITEHFERKTDDAHNAADAPEESMGLSDEDLSSMHVQGDKSDPSVEDLPEDERTSKWRLI